jgi:hypothetical protein
MNWLRSLKHWDRGFEYHSRHEYLCVRLYLCLCCPVYVAAMRRADRSSKESYSLCKKDYGTEEEARAQQTAVEPLMNE